MSIIVEGYAAIFGTPDKSGDVIQRGAFSDWLKAIGSDLVLPIYWTHDHSKQVGGKLTAMPIGATMLIAQRDAGLYFKAQLASSPKAAAVAELVRLGAATGSSIGYSVLDGGEKRIKGGGRALERLAVGEISITPTGRAMHPAAFVRPAAAGEAPVAETQEGVAA